MSKELSQATKKNKRNTIITGVLSAILCVAPILAALILGFFKASTTGRCGLTMVGIASLILTAVGFLTKHKLGDVCICIVIVALYYTSKSAIPIVVLYAACALVDRLIVSPLHASFKEKYVINKEYDKRERGNS